jgi:hypothetical protein
MDEHAQRAERGYCVRLEQVKWPAGRAERPGRRTDAMKSGPYFTRHKWLNT